MTKPALACHTSVGKCGKAPVSYSENVSDFTKGHTVHVVPIPFETFGGFSPAAVRFFEQMRDLVDNRLTHAQYEETTWSARSWMAFQTQKISVALQRAACLEVACDLGHAGALSAEAWCAQPGVNNPRAVHTPLRQRTHCQRWAAGFCPPSYPSL